MAVTGTPQNRENVPTGPQQGVTQMLDVLLFIIILVGGLAFAVLFGIALDRKPKASTKKSKATPDAADRAGCGDALRS